MGKDKGLVPLAGQPLVKYVAKVLSSVAEEVIVSVARDRREVYANALGDDFEFVEDKEDGQGPLEGLVRGLDAARGDYVVVSPCDTPFLRKEVCEAIIRAASGKDAAVPKTGFRFLEPLHGVYRRSTCGDAFAKTLASGRRTPTLAYDELDIVFLDEPTLRTIDPDLLSFRNVNSPEELRKAEAQACLLR